MVAVDYQPYKRGPDGLVITYMYGAFRIYDCQGERAFETDFPSIYRAVWWGLTQDDPARIASVELLVRRRRLCGSINPGLALEQPV